MASFPETKLIQNSGWIYRVCLSVMTFLKLKKKKNCLESYLLDEELVLEVREGGFKVGGVLLDVPTVYTVPVVLVTVDGYTVAVLF